MVFVGWRQSDSLGALHLCCITAVRHVKSQNQWRARNHGVKRQCFLRSKLAQRIKSNNKTQRFYIVCEFASFILRFETCERSCFLKTVWSQLESLSNGERTMACQINIRGNWCYVNGLCCCVAFWVVKGTLFVIQVNWLSFDAAYE